MTRLEIACMLDSLGPTLSLQTINTFLTRFSKDPLEGSTTVSQTVQLLESGTGEQPGNRYTGREIRKEKGRHVKPVLQTIVVMSG